ncbi:MAG: TRIC cation channel family protein [Desulfovibrio sp.]|nr:TRIC cation channel family protein [Desulfovibrio sp.]
MDITASMVLACAAACRARSSGVHFSGAAVLACVVGMSTPLARDCLLGSAVPTLNQGAYLAFVVAGALLAEIFARTRASRKIFFWLDGMGLALASGIGAVKAAIWGMGLTGSFLMGLISGLMGGFVRDVALGDLAAFVEESMYATAAAIGAVVALGVLFYAGLDAWQCALAGSCLALSLRVFFARPCF